MWETAYQIFCRTGIGLEPGCTRYRRGLSSAKSLRRSDVADMV
jgi:hypothetical protein